MSISRSAGPTFRFSHALILAGIIFVGFWGILTFVPAGSSRLFLTDALLPLVNLLAVLALAFAAWRSYPHSKRLGLAWFVMALAQFCYLAGDVAWWILETVLHQEPFPSIADWLYLSYYPLFMFAVHILPGEKLSWRENLETLLDITIATLAVLLGFSDFLLDPLASIDPGTSWIARILGLAYPAGGLVLFWALILILYKKSPGQSRTPLRIIAVSLFVMVITDYAFSYQSLNGSYVSGGYLDLGYVLVCLLAALAGVLQGRNFKPTLESAGSAVQEKNQSTDPRQEWMFYFPYLCTILAYRVLFLLLRASPNDRFTSVFIGVGVTVGFVIVRQIMALNKNSVLMGQIRRQAGALKEANQRLSLEVVERRQAEENLNKTLQMLNAAIAASPLAIEVLDQNEKIQLWSPAAELLFGWKQDEVIGKAVPTVPDEIRAETNQSLATCYQGESLAGLETYRLRKDRSKIDVSISTAPLRDAQGQITGIMAILADITEHKQYEDRIRSLARFPDEDPNPVARIGSDGVLSYANHACTPLLALWKCGVGEMLPPSNIRFIQSVLTQGQSVEAEVACGERIFNILIVPYPDSGYANCYGRDVTEQRRVEAQIQRRAAELEALAMVSASLRQAKTFDEIVSALISITLEVLHADSGSLILYAGQDSLQPAAQDPALIPLEWQLALSGNAAQQAFQNRQVYATAGSGLALQAEPGSPSVENHRGGPICAFSLVPIQTSEMPIGCLCIGFYQPHPFAPEEKRLLSAIAEIAGNALHRTSMMNTLEQRVRVRTHELAALYDIAAITSGNLDIQSILDQSLGEVLEIYGSRIGTIHLQDREQQGLQLAAQKGIPVELAATIRAIPTTRNPWGSVIERGHACIFTPTEADPGFTPAGFEDYPNTYLGAPICSEGEVLGVLSILLDDVQQCSVEEIALLETIANQIGVAVNNAFLRQRSQEAAVIEERQRLARDLHDSVTQSLFSLNLLAEGYRDQVQNASLAEIEAWLSELSGSAHQALKEMRLLLYELRPHSLEQDGLPKALQRRLDAVEKKSGVKAQLAVQGDARLPIRGAGEIYRIAQEALNNISKHAAATEVSIVLQIEKSSVKMEITDNGIGFDPSAERYAGMGLINMVERAKKLGGELKVDSCPGLGASIKFLMEGRQ